MGRRANNIEVEFTEGAIRVDFAGRKVTIKTAAPEADASDEVDFVVLLDEIVFWDPPDDDKPIEIDELQKILAAIEKQMEKHGLNVDFD